MLFEFKIYHKEIIKLNKQYITNTDKYNKCKFYFDKETWQDKQIFVTFINKDGYAQNVILGKWDEVLSCAIPDGITNKEYFKVFAYGRDYFKTNTLKVDMKKRNCAIENRRKNATDYLLEKLNTKIDNIVFEDNQLKCYSDGRLVDTIYIKNIDEVVVKDIINNHFDEFQQRLEAKLEGYLSEDDLDFLIISL